MTHTITLSDQITFTANDDETVLAAATRQNLNLPHSCKSGACGQCKAELMSGEFEMGDLLIKPSAQKKKRRAKCYCAVLLRRAI